MNILIIDDHALMEEGIKSRIHQVLPDAQCFFSLDFRNAIAIVHQHKIDLIFCDLQFSDNPEIDGFYIIKHLKQYEPFVKSIALTSYNSYRIMKKAISSGFNSFLDKGCSLFEFSETLINVLDIGNYTSESMEKLLKKKDHFLKNIFSNSLIGMYELSKRELELLLLVNQTINREELAAILCISPFTVDSHFKNILSKLQLGQRKELVLFAEEFRGELEQLK